MSDKKIIAVVGATGAQGGGLVRAILDDPQREFTPRAITRKPDSDKAQALRAQGVEVVAADLDDVNSLTRAFTGAHAAFCLTNFWDHFSAEKELQQARNLAQAAKNADVKHAVWSTLEDTREWLPISDARMPVLQGKYNVPHFDAKGEADKVFDRLGVPVTHLRTSFYWDNMIFFGLGPKPGPDGKLAITLPMGDKRLPGIAVEDIGKCALAIFKHSGEFIGKTIGISGEQLTGAQMADFLSKSLGREVRYNEVPPDVYRSFGFPGADEMGNMFQIKRDFEPNYCANRAPEFARRLNPGLMSFEAWLSQNAGKIPLE